MITTGMHEYIRIRQAIVNLAGHLGSKRALPSERTLSEEFQVSRSTVRQAFDDLVKIHWLIKCPKRGYYTTEKTWRTDKIIGILMYDALLTYTVGPEVRAMAELYREALNYPFALQIIVAPNMDAFIKSLGNCGLDGILWYGVPKDMLSCYERIRDAKIPIAAIFQNVNEPETSGDYLFLNHRKEFYRTTKYLLERGARRILMPDLRETTEFLEGARAALTEYGLEWCPELIFREDCFAEELPALYERTHFDGALCRFEESRILREFAAEHSIAIPDALQIITGESSFKKDTTYSQKPFAEIFHLCFRSLSAQLSGKESRPMRNRRLEWNIVPGVTTKP